MKISIVIPAYNEEMLLGPCLEHVLRSLKAARLQEDEYQIVVVNNASTDRTREVALSYPHVTVVDEPKKGITRARQAGFAAATGDIIACPDADTHMPEEWVSTVLSEFENSPDLVALSGPYVYYDVPGYARVLTTAFLGVGFFFHTINNHVLRIGGMLQGGNYAARRTALEKIGGYDTSIEFYGEDTDIGRRLAKVGKVRWTWRLPMHSSGRRLAREGVFKVGVEYAINYLSTTFSGKPVTSEYKDHRHTTTTQ